MTRIAFPLVFECEDLGVSVLGFERGGMESAARGHRQW